MLMCDAPAEQIGAGLLAAAIGNVDDVDPGRLLERLADDVRHGRQPEAERELARIGLGVVTSSGTVLAGTAGATAITCDQ